MAEDASVAALQARRYQLNLRKETLEAEKEELQDRIEALDLDIAAYDTQIDAIDASLADIRAKPVLTALNIYSVVRETTSNTLVVTGSGFVTAATLININGTNRATTVASATSASCAIPDSLVEETGTLTIYLFSPGPGGGTSSSLYVQVINGDPVISALDPDDVTEGEDDLLLTVEGTFLYEDSVIYLNGEEVETELVGEDLTCTIPAELMTTAGVHVSVSVVNPTPGGGQASPVVLTVSA
jgi:hypothetical protein